MEWLNLHSSTLDSVEFIGATPTQRSTWLCLLRFCIGQENKGRIAGAVAWGDRKWQQLVRVTLREIDDVCDLWRVDGNDLEVNFYPVSKQLEIESKRQAGKDTVGKRWGKHGCSVNNSADSSAISSATRSAHTEGEGEGKGKEKGNRKEKDSGANGSPPTSKSVDDVTWLAELAANEAYAGIDVRRELGKMRAWCATNGKQPSRRRFINWLNRAEKPLNGGRGDTEISQKKMAELHGYTY